MPYIGKTPLTGAYQLCDTITTSATATYNLTVGGSAVIPGSAQNCIVSLNGVIQAPVSAFTVSGSQITFSSALTATDVINFILILGNVFDIGTPTNGSVTNSSLNSNVITGQTAVTAPATDDVLLCYDTSATALRKITFANFGNTPAFFAYKSTSQTFADNTNTKIQFDNELFDSNNCYDNSTNYRFTPTAGKYFMFASVQLYSGSSVSNIINGIYKNGSRIAYQALVFSTGTMNANDGQLLTIQTIDTANGTDYYEIFAQQNNTGGGTVTVDYNPTERYTFFGAYRLIGV